MVNASMNSRRRSAIAFPATKFTASDDGLAGVTTTRKPPTTRPSTAPRACPKLPLRAVDGIASPMKLAPVRHRSRRQQINPTACVPRPFRPHTHDPPAPEMQERWRSSLPLGAIVSAAFSPPGPVTIASGGARLGRRCWTATRPRSGRSRQGSKPKAETPKAVRFTRARRAGLVPARAPHLQASFSPCYDCREKGFSDALGWFDLPQISQTMVDSI